MSRTVRLGAAVLFSAAWLTACGGTNQMDANGSSDTVAALTDRSASLVMACSGCHAAGGTGIVSLDTYTEPLLIEALTRYQTEADGTTVMHRLARGYSDEDIALISAALGTVEDGE